MNEIAVSEIKVDLVKNLTYGGEHIVMAGTFDEHSDYVIIGTGHAVIERFDTEHLIAAEVKKLRDMQRSIAEKNCDEVAEIENRIKSIQALRAPKGER